MTFFKWVDSLDTQELRTTDIASRVLQVMRKKNIHEVADLPYNIVYEMAVPK